MVDGLDALVGRTVGFCGVDGNVVCLSVDGRRLAFEAIEDEADGYRSSLSDLVQVPVTGHAFFRRSIAQLRVERDEELEGHRLVSDDGHVWLRIGTANADDWYPMFTFCYDPPR